MDKKNIIRHSCTIPRIATRTHISKRSSKNKPSLRDSKYGGVLTNVLSNSSDKKDNFSDYKELDMSPEK